MEVTVLHSQSMLDIAIMHTGSVMNAFDIAVANDMAITDSLTPGNSIIIPDDIVTNDDILNYYQTKKIQPATAIIDESIIPAGKGIGWMRIGTTFKVS